MADKKLNAASTPPSLATLVLLSGSAAMVMNVFIASLPEMAQDFGVEYSQIQLAITAYLVFTAFAQIIIGPLSDRYGRRPVVMVMYLIFALASLGAAMADSFHNFMIFRMAQCAVVSGLVISRASVRDQMAGNKAASMIAYVTMGMSLVPMIAPAFGGLLHEVFGWRANFYFLSALGLFTFLMVYIDFGETKTERASSLFNQLKAYPILLRSRRFWGYTLILCFASGMFFSYLSAGPLIGHEVYQLSSGELGLYLGAAPLGYFFGNWISARKAMQWGVHRLIITGLMISIIGMALALIPAFLGWSAPIWFFGFMYFIGFGNGMTNPSANAGMLDARPEYAGTASGLSGAIMMIGGAALAQYAGHSIELNPKPEHLIGFILTSGLLALSIAYWVFRVEARNAIKAKENSAK